MQFSFLLRFVLIFTKQSHFVTQNQVSKEKLLQYLSVDVFGSIFFSK